MRWKVKTAGKVRMQPWARCDDECGWTSGHSDTTRDAARRHVAMTGHDVVVTIEDRTLYSPDGDGFD